MKNLLRSLLLLSILLFCASVNTEAQTAFRLFAGTFAQRPVSCVAADVYWSTNTSHFYIGAGAPCSWVDFGSGGGGAGTVTSVSVVSANGLAGTVATATTTPAITLSTTITGLLKGNGTAISAASAGTDYVTSSSTNTFTNKTYDTAGSGNSFSINGVAVTANTGTGAVARAASPVFTGPTLGIALATSLNGNTFTTGTYTLTGASGKTFTFNNNLTIAGTDGVTSTWPTTNFTAARTDLGQTFSGANTFTGASGDIPITINGTQPPAQSGANPGTSGGSAFVLTGQAGGDTSSTSANTNGGAGSSINQTAGAGGQQTGAASGTARGGNGGTFNQASGAGGNATAVTGTVKGGAGGGVNRTAANGGTSATSTGGAGGGISDTAGTGGITTAAAISGAGGAWTALGGNGGANSNAAGTSGAGGAVTIDAGAAGVASGGAAAGNPGAVVIGNTNASGVNIGRAATTTTINGHLAVEGQTSTGSTGTGKIVFDGTPTLVTPVLGAATATTLNGNTFTTGTYTLTGGAGKTLTFNNSLAITATDGITMTTPTTSFTAARTDAANTFTGHQTIEGVTSTGAAGSGKIMFNTSPAMTTGINDTNGLTLLKFTATASAVDGFTFTNAATANPATVQFAATGTDTNIHMAIIPKGSGAIVPGATGTVDLGTTSLGWRQLFVDQTITAIGTTGSQTINKTAGTVNIAAAASTATVTNSLVTANSLVFITARTNDTTCTVKNAVPASGSFVVNMSANCTATTSVGFIVINQ